jgi:hypothetical protein
VVSVRIYIIAITCALAACGCDSGTKAVTEPEAETESEPGSVTASETESETEAEAEAEPAADRGPTPGQAVMRGHFEQARIARAALTRADLETAKEAMAWLGGHPLADTLPEPARPRMARFQATAAQFARVQNVREAALALARTARQCGECHRAMDMGPSFARPPLPEGDNPISHMRRHHWATDRMWEGLVAGDPERFAEAAQGFQEPPLSAAELGAAPRVQAELESLIRHVHQLGARAADAADDAARADVYGALLASCAACHRVLERGPSPLPAP